MKKFNVNVCVTYRIKAEDVEKAESVAWESLYEDVDGEDRAIDGLEGIFAIHVEEIEK